jgi:hypothetical protein
MPSLATWCEVLWRVWNVVPLGTIWAARRHLLSTASTPPTSYTFAEGNQTDRYGKWDHLRCKSNYVDRSLDSEDLSCNLNILICILGTDSPVLCIVLLLLFMWLQFLLRIYRHRNSKRRVLCSVRYCHWSALGPLWMPAMCSPLCSRHCWY